MINVSEKLEQLGLDPWFASRLDTQKLNQFQLARITRVNKDNYVIHTEHETCLAKIPSQSKFNAQSALDYPTVGDWVYVSYLDNDDIVFIDSVIPRKTYLKRKSAGKRAEAQLIAANIDTAFIMQSINLDYNLKRLERYLVITRSGNIRPVVLLSKIDLLPEEIVQEKIYEIQSMIPDITVLTFSNVTQVGLTHIKELLGIGETFCLLGSSGVGKTTLLNNLLGEAVFKTQSIREKDSKGRHTTTHRQLNVLANHALLIDTPGMRELSIVGDEEGIDETFDDLQELALSCRYTNCGHTVENNCAILAAVEGGDISEEHYQNYLKIQKEAARNERSYYENRQKSRKFSKMVKSVVRGKRKR